MKEKENKKDCTCKGECTCTPEHHCGCGGHTKNNSKQNNKDCCSNTNTDCTCNDECNCTPKDNCGCGEYNTNKNNETCGCNNQNNKDCNCTHDGEKDCNCNNNQEQYKQLFAELTSALANTQKQLKSATDEMLNNQRLAVSYKKDLERFKERNKNIETDAKNNATEDVAIKIIPILDQFETALSATKDSAEKQGYNMIYSSLKKAVESLGVSEISSLGEQFDSNLHNAISKVQTTDKSKDNVVTSVYQKGYKLTANDKIIRYAMVEIGEYKK